MSAAPETAPPVNDVPDELLDLAKEAMKRGFATVRLGFGWMGYDFPAPISWMLWLDKTAARMDYAGSIASLTLDTQRSELDAGEDGLRPIDANAVYVGHEPKELTGGADYWDLATVREWLDTPVTAEDSLRPSWSPVTDEANQEVLLGDWEDFERAARAGWCVERKIEDLFRIEGLRSIGLSLDASNNFYNVEGHPQHRSTGAELSRQVWRSGMLTTTDAPWSIEPGALTEIAELRVVHLGADELGALTGSPAPWFVPVASVTPDTEDTDGEWVLPAAATDWSQG